VSWFATSIGQRLLAEEQRGAIPLLTQHIGVRGMYLRPERGAAATLSGNMLQSVLNLHQQGPRLGGDFEADIDALPVESDALCLAYALHSLDLCASPAPFIDELRRTLRPDGVLFLIGVSPLSLWQLRWRGTGLHARSARHVRALLAVAGLNVEAEVGLGPLMPFLRDTADAAPAPRAAPASLLDPFRAGYLLIARKRRLPLTPVSQQRQRATVGGAALQPQARAG
jgi:SAM-dependent methyltransferase